MITDAKIGKVFHARLCPISICAFAKTISRKGAKVALVSRNDDQSPINKLVSGRLDKNPAKSISASTYYSQKEPKYVADLMLRDIFFYDIRKKHRSISSLLLDE
jgi:hypothetical protein